jgi:hypothetical protein
VFVLAAAMGHALWDDSDDESEIEEAPRVDSPIQFHDEEYLREYYNACEDEDSDLSDWEFGHEIPMREDSDEDQEMVQEQIEEHVALNELTEETREDFEFHIEDYIPVFIPKVFSEHKIGSFDDSPGKFIAFDHANLFSRYTRYE